MNDHNISARTPDGIWLTGMVEEYPFEAKVCDEASGFGIDCGRVIKLHIGKKNSNDDVAAYERGWDKYPCRAHITGTVFVDWDCGSGLGVVYGEDYIRKL